MFFKPLFVVLAVTACVVYSQAPPPPPFLVGAPASTVNEFNQLLATSGGLTDPQIDAAVDAWVAKQSDDIKSKHEQFKQEKNKQQEAAKAAHAAALANFSPEAKDADAKLSAIADNLSLTAQDKSQQIQQLLGSLPANVRQEIEASMQG
uniref:SXP/RAL-2 family protein Ani s 5-like cation-binding domain-containing protein n=1 Tax=Acrobeloides nanus TaxID=290746 RepID=A0A914C4C8_9BILA